MKCILINIKKDGNRIKKILHHFKNNESSFQIELLNYNSSLNKGLILIVPDNIYDELLNIRINTESFINSFKFISSVLYNDYLFYNEKDNTCILFYNSGKFFNIILESLENFFSQNTLISIYIKINDKDIKSVLKTLNKFHYTHPIINSLNNTDFLVLTKNPSEPVNQICNMNLINDFLNQYKNHTCKIFARLTKNALKFLKNTSYSGFTIENGEKQQKELTGELTIKNIKHKSGNYVYIIDVERRSVSSGSSENVQVNGTRYNFHSHPKQAYVKHSVSNAWPSVLDFLGLFSLSKNTIFHCVATIEGLYTMTFSEYWCDKLNMIDESFIRKNYNIDLEVKLTPYEFIDKVNKIYYKNFPIFNVGYYEWHNAYTEFEIHFSKTNLSCIPAQKTKSIYKKINLISKK